MGQTLLAATASGLALGGFLAVAGVAAGRFSNGMPHLGPAAVGAGVAVLAARLTALPAPLALLILAVVAAVAGATAWQVDRRARNVDAPVWPPALLPDVGVVGFGVAAAALLRPDTVIELPLGPLGGLASASAGVGAFGVGVAGAFIAAALLRRRPAAGWVVAVAVAAVAVALGGGSIAFAGEPTAIALGVPDVVGLALRAAAVGVVARARALPAVAAAVVLGVGESLLRSQASLSEAAVVPALAVIAWGLWATNRTPAVQPA